MRLLRSWPSQIPEGRSYVFDDIERLVISGHHYGPLANIDDDVLLLEWDIAVGQEDLLTFASRAEANPDRLIVAPYRIYADTYNLPYDVWAHRKWDGVGAGTVIPHGAYPIRDGQPTCNLFGLGMVYLPRAVLRPYFVECADAQFKDTSFSMWHYQKIVRDVQIMWDVRPVHLNYLIPKIT